ncbi:exosortase V [Sphingobium sufflavum]|uniref:exosortase V n=1 Tax=Sphingobium sufflavum TaxID=1129547 RepID=UPI001F2F7BAA|nr:exosortase V [Sphingobium sufflavum]MCE7798525.1 exosortase V [Sphingobium sufflavum]
MDANAAAPGKWLPTAPVLVQHWPSLLGLAILAIPTIIALAQSAWQLESGNHGPLVLATGLWLLSRKFPQMRAHQLPPRTLVIVAGLVVALPLYIFGRAFDFISIETAGLYFATIILIYNLVGWSGLKIAIWPLIYLGFLIPPPGWIIDQITAPLREFVSFTSTGLLTLFGYPIVRQGVAIFIAQYQLLVEDACSGMHSIMGLTAITLFYIYIIHVNDRVHPHWRRIIVLALAVLPIAIVTNIIRVMILILITYYFGDSVAQGFLHSTTGIMIFVVGLLLMFLLDWVLNRTKQAVSHPTAEQPA